jgi:hypothetical protein
MFSKNNVTQSMIDAVESVLVEDKKLLLEPENEKKEKKEVKEALKGGQVKLDKNHNGKLDKKDFELLRMKKEEVKDEYARKVDAYLKKKHAPDAPAQPKTEEDMKESATLAAAVIGSAALMRASQKYKDWKAKNASKSVKKEEVEELDELSVNTLNRVHRAAVSAGNDASREGDEGKADKRYNLAGKASNKAEVKNRAAGLKPSGQHTMGEATESKKDFQARQERLAAAAAQTAKDPARLKRMMSIPGYSAAMGLANKTTAKEEVETLDELSKKTLGSYAKKASRDAVITRKIGADFENRADRARSPGMKAASDEISQKYKEKSWKRRDGVDKAVDRLANEEVELDEAINDNMHPTGVALLKHIKPEHHNLYKPHLTTDVFNGSFKDRHDVLSAAKQAGHLREDIGGISTISEKKKKDEAIRVDTLKGVTTSTDPEVKIANAHFSGKKGTLKAEGKGTDTAVPFVTDSVTPTHREINKAVKPTFKKIKEMLGKTGTSE